MRINTIDFPKNLISAIRNGNLVVFAGAGISKGPPANLPDFKLLATKIADGSGETQQENEPIDRFLGRLNHKGVFVHARASDLLTLPFGNNTQLHIDLLRLWIISKFGYKSCRF